MLPEEKHVLTVLKTTMRVLGYSNRDLERQLSLSGSYLSRLFSGDIDLRFSHILDLSRAMGLEPEEMLLLVYPPDRKPKSPAAQRLEDLMSSLQEPPQEGMAARPTRQEIEMEEAIEHVVSGLLEKLGPVALFGGVPEAQEEPAPAPLPEPLPERPRRKRRSQKREP